MCILNTSRRGTQLPRSGTPTFVWKRDLGGLGVGFLHSGEKVREISFEWERAGSSPEAQRWQAAVVR